jgi:NifU-like protein involved in Fe-S cluster formation
MSALRRTGCCSVVPRMSVSELFERGYRRSRAAPFAAEGERIAIADGNWTRFSVEAMGGTLACVSFRASTCATLIAYCELIAELIPGFAPEVAAEMTADELITALPGVPPQKHDRAVAAIAALRSALVAAGQAPSANR